MSVVLLTDREEGKAQRVLTGIVEVFQRRLPAPAPSIYVIGSHGHGTPLPSSDIDLLVVIDRVEDEARARSVMEWCTRISPVPVDASVITLTDLLGRYCAQIPFLINASVLICGDDLLHKLRLPAMPDYTASTILLARHCVGLTRGGDWLSEVHDYPRPADEFFGYVDWGRQSPPWRRSVPNTKLLVATVWRLLYAALAIDAGIYAESRHQCHEAVRMHLGKSARQRAEEVEKLRSSWHYLVPDAPAERAELREICSHVMDFEREVLTSCNEWETGASRMESESQ